MHFIWGNRGKKGTCFGLVFPNALHRNQQISGKAKTSTDFTISWSDVYYIKQIKTN